MASKGFFSRLGRVRILGASISAAAILFVSGIFFWGGFNTAMEATNSLEFCISCHEMENNVYQEYKKTIHYENRTGVRATCADCHVPHPWIHKMIRKIQASGELWHKVMGSVATAEKFEAKRLDLAKRVWHTMKTTDSRECRNCHSFDAMGAEKQKPRARKQHELAREDGQTCIDCHKGIAHKPVHQLLEGGDKTAAAAPAPAVIPVAA
ncbi:MAG: NapC/NirT family cytochrome c, partial [Alphaproteobacteria bacterium]|nr:NapC/NirT family cytochrome c [Alphaproteobacteria bacterium]